MTRTRQEIFDIAYRGLKSQGFRRSGNDAECWYRGPDGLKCAIGHLINDDDYTPDLECFLAKNKAILAFANVSANDDWFLDDLQKCHDHAPWPERMAASLREFAEEYGLTIPEDNE